MVTTKQVVKLLDICQSVGWQMVTWCGFNLHFRLTSEVEPDSMYIKAIFKLSLFFTQILGTFCVLGILALYDVSWSYFSPFVIVFGSACGYWYHTYFFLSQIMGNLSILSSLLLHLKGLFYSFPHVDFAHFLLYLCSDIYIYIFFALGVGSCLLLCILTVVLLNEGCWFLYVNIISCHFTKFTKFVYCL